MCSQAQLLKSQNIQLFLHSTVKGADFKDIAYQSKFFNKDQAKKEIGKILQALQAKAYLLAGVDSLQEDSLNIHAFISRNTVFEWANVRLGNLNQGLAAKVGFSEKKFQHKALYYKEINVCIEKILRFYENTGYPFATVQLDSVSIENNGLSTVLNVQKNKYFKIDSVLIKGSLKLNEGFIRQYYGIQSGMPYNEEVLAALSQKTRQLPFILEKQEQRVQLSNKTNKLILFYDKKEASQFDGIVGFLPDATTKKTILTGDVKLKLVNGILKNGETFDLEWRRLKSQTQDFNGRITYPFIFKSPLGIDYNLKIYRRDSTFIDINSNVAIQYYFHGLNYFKLFYKQRNGNLISTNGYEFISTLPDYADVITQAYGLGLFYEQLDYRFNPKKGISVNVSWQAGNRHIKKNPKINPLAYDQIVLNSAQYQMEGHISYYIHLLKNNVLKLALQGASVFGNNSIYKNELFRIGGLKTLRGFDEESIFTSSYVISTLEYRFLYSKNSNIFVFSDGAWYENLSNHKYNNDTPMSVGAGISFETKAGILSISYALGNQLGNGFDARSGKIHFGLSALF
ncbi:MAG: hypothetical protein WCR21_10060 [Bacteroidota bacterium]